MPVKQPTHSTQEEIIISAEYARLRAGYVEALEWAQTPQGRAYLQENTEAWLQHGSIQQYIAYVHEAIAGLDEFMADL